MSELVIERPIIPASTEPPDNHCEAACREMSSRLRGKQQQCPVCREVFTGPTAADAHRIVADTYDLIRVDGRLVRTELKLDEKGRRLVPAGGSLVSVGNQLRRCLTRDELAAKGLVLDDRGRWRFAPSAARGWWQ